MALLSEVAEHGTVAEHEVVDVDVSEDGGKSKGTQPKTEAREVSR